jgi:translation initiation factor 3 subunit M
LLPESSPDANTAALDTIVATLQLPTVFDLNHLLKVKALQTVKDHPLFGLLRILLYGDLAQYKEWQAANTSTIDEFGLHT